MSGDRKDGRGVGGWLLPVLIVIAGVCLMIVAARRGMLRPVALKPVNWIGFAVMLAGCATAVASSFVASRREEAGRWQLLRLAGVVVCGVGAIMVVCL